MGWPYFLLFNLYVDEQAKQKAEQNIKDLKIDSTAAKKRLFASRKLTEVLTEAVDIQA